MPAGAARAVACAQPDQQPGGNQRGVVGIDARRRKRRRASHSGMGFQIQPLSHARTARLYTAGPAIYTLGSICGVQTSSTLATGNLARIYTAGSASGHRDNACVLEDAIAVEQQGVQVGEGSDTPAKSSVRSMKKLPSVVAFAGITYNDCVPLGQRSRAAERTDAR